MTGGSVHVRLFCVVINIALHPYLDVLADFEFHRKAAWRPCMSSPVDHGIVDHREISCRPENCGHLFSLSPFGTGRRHSSYWPRFPTRSV